MELNLRKARKLEGKIDKLIVALNNELKTSKSVRVNADIQSEVLPELVKARTDFLNAFKNINSLIDARFEIRGLIGKQNEVSGINLSINKKVNLEQRLSKINNVIRNFDFLDEKELEDDSSRYRTMLENGDRFSRSNFDANFLLSSDENSFRDEYISITKEIENVEDSLLDLNGSTKIKLRKEIVDLLQANNLL